MFLNVLSVKFARPKNGTHYSQRTISNLDLTKCLTSQSKLIRQCWSKFICINISLFLWLVYMHVWWMWKFYCFQNGSHDLPVVSSMGLLLHVFHNTLADFFKEGNKTHDTGEATSVYILFLDKIVLKNCSIILPSPDKYQLRSDTSLLLHFVDCCP